MTATLICRTCGAEKPLDAFSASAQKNQPRWRPQCKVCRGSRGRANQARNPGYGYGRRLEVKYGITIEQYEEQLRAQDGKCAICQSPEPRGKGGRRFHVDHDHETGKLRGLLCNDCNTGLGLFRDDVFRLNAAIWYLWDETPAAFVGTPPGRLL